MPANDMNLANQPGAAFRAELNQIIQLLLNHAASSAEPDPTFAHMSWFDTSGAGPVWKVRDATNTAWVSIGTFGVGGFELAGSTTFARQLLTAANGADARNVLSVAFASQAEAEAGVNTSKYMNPLRVAQAIAALSGGQTMANFAAADPDAVGTVQWLGSLAGGIINFGQFYAGSSLVRAGFLSLTTYNDKTAATIRGAAQTGTWQALGDTTGAALSRKASTLFKKVSD